MFSFDPLSPLFNATVEIVAQNPGISVGDLRTKLKQQAGQSVSLQHVYRIVTRLVETQILLKRKRQLTLNLLWLSTIELFAQTAKTRLLDDKETQTLQKLATGKRATFQAKSLKEMQSIWHHLLIQINRLVPAREERILFKYYSHAWWLLGSGEDAAFYERIAKRGVQCFWLIGNETYLDLLAVKNYKRIFRIAVADRPPFLREGYCLNILGAYVLECVFPKAISDHLELLFRSVRSDRDWKQSILDDIFHIHAPMTVTVTHNPKRAMEFRQKIAHWVPGAPNL